MGKRKAPRHIGIVMAIFHSAEKLRRENSALRTILRRQGLTDAAIRKRVLACKRVKTEEELSESLLRQCCEEFLKRLGAIDVERELASLPESNIPVAEFDLAGSTTRWKKVTEETREDS